MKFKISLSRLTKYSMHDVTCSPSWPLTQWLTPPLLFASKGKDVAGICDSVNGIGY